MSDAFSLTTLPPIGWVSDLKSEDRELLASYGEFISATPEHDLIEQGWQQTHLYLVVSGSLAVRSIGLDQDISLGSLGVGECVGEMSIFDPGPASASVRATQFSRVWRINRDSLMAYLSDSPGSGILLLGALSTILSKRIRALSQQLVESKT